MAQPVSDDIAAMLDSCDATCHLLPEQDEGPYRRGDQPVRRDVTEGRDGSPLRLGIRFRTQRGDPMADVEVEIWQCDASGRYSGYPPNDPARTEDHHAQRAEYLEEETFLRGCQTTDGLGDVEFRTVYPGWYPGRAVHIHLMAHTQIRTYTSQLYFPQVVTREALAHGPYRDRGMPDTTNESDTIFPTGGEPAVLDIRPDGPGHIGLIDLVLP